MSFCAPFRGVRGRYGDISTGASPTNVHSVCVLELRVMKLFPLRWASCLELPTVTYGENDYDAESLDGDAAELGFGPRSADKVADGTFSYRAPLKPER
jgi:hypothetical protein